jgi:hypothetical protein
MSEAGGIFLTRPSSFVVRSPYSCRASGPEGETFVPAACDGKVRGCGEMVKSTGHTVRPDRDDPGWVSSSIVLGSTRAAVN